METERAGKQREEPKQKESDIEIIGKEEGERLKETRESWMGMPAKNCDQREKKSRRKGRSEAQGGKRAAETSCLVPVSSSQPSARVLCSTHCALQLQLLTFLREAGFRAQLAWNPFPLPVLPWPEVSRPGLCSCCPTTSIPGGVSHPESLQFH